MSIKNLPKDLIETSRKILEDLDKSYTKKQDEINKVSGLPELGEAKETVIVDKVRQNGKEGFAYTIVSGDKTRYVSSELFSSEKLARDAGIQKLKILGEEAEDNKPGAVAKLDPDVDGIPANTVADEHETEKQKLSEAFTQTDFNTILVNTLNTLPDFIGYGYREEAKDFINHPKTKAEITFKYKKNNKVLDLEITVSDNTRIRAEFSGKKQYFIMTKHDIDLIKQFALSVLKESASQIKEAFVLRDKLTDILKRMKGLKPGKKDGASIASIVAEFAKIGYYPSSVLKVNKVLDKMDFSCWDETSRNINNYNNFMYQLQDSLSDLHESDSLGTYDNDIKDDDDRKVLHVDVVSDTDENGVETFRALLQYAKGYTRLVPDKSLPGADSEASLLELISVIEPSAIELSEEAEEEPELYIEK